MQYFKLVVTRAYKARHGTNVVQQWWQEAGTNVVQQWWQEAEESKKVHQVMKQWARQNL
jgi:hypothetical protein